MANLKDIVATLAILGAGTLTLTGCEKKAAETTNPDEVKAADGATEGEASCSGDKAEGEGEASCSGGEAEGEGEASCSGGEAAEGEASCSGAA